VISLEARASVCLFDKERSNTGSEQGVERT
jgi:hypothetical protein